MKRNKFFFWSATALLVLGITASCSTPKSTQVPYVEPGVILPTPTTVSLTDFPGRLPDCDDVISENETNLPGLNDSGDLVMCNPDLTVFYDTLPDSYFDDDTLRLYEDGSYSIMISRTYTDSIDIITVSRLASDCAYPNWGCTP